jgi:amidase
MPVLAMTAGAVPPALEQSLERVAVLDATLHAVIALDPDAPARSRALESERRAGSSRGLLHGMPLLVKDNIDTEGVLATTAGCTVLRGNVAGRDAPAVAALRAAGAVIIGKANLSEWANFRSTRPASGWSAVGGLTANPYALDRSAGGSSSGSGAAVAAGYVPAALGTETDGSIICPAALCGCVGLKPTAGLISRAGVVPISHSQDSVGPIARTVRLAAAVLDAMAGSSLLEAIGGGCAGLRVGVPRSMSWGHHDGLDAACEGGLSALAASGASVVDGISLGIPERLGDDELCVMLHEFHAGVDAYLAEHPAAGARNLEQLIEQHSADAGETRHFGQELFLLAADTPGLDDPAYRAALERCRRAGREEGIDAALASGELDALAMPAYPPAWKSDLVNGDPRHIESATQLAAVAGYPIVTVPVGLVAGLPVGLALVGTAHSEGRLARLAAAIEAVLGPLPPPTFRPPATG